MRSGKCATSASQRRPLQAIAGEGRTRRDCSLIGSAQSGPSWLWKVPALRRSCAIPSRRRRASLHLRRDVRIRVTDPAAAPEIRNVQAHAFRRRASRRDSGRRHVGQPARRIRHRDLVQETGQGKHLPRESDARRTVAAGGLRGIRRRPSRLPGVRRNSSGLLPDSDRGPAEAA